MCGAPVTRFDLGDYMIPLTQYLVYPPLEGRFFKDMIRDCVLCKFNGV